MRGLGLGFDTYALRRWKGNRTGSGRASKALRRAIAGNRALSLPPSCGLVILRDMPRSMPAGEYDCPSCKQRKAFYANTGVCIDCHKSRASTRTMADSSKQRRNARARIRDRQNRIDPNWRPRFIIRDAKKMDKRRGFTNNLTVQAVSALLSVDECPYCGVSPDEVKMSLDRLDNDRPHTIDNVIACCLTCNFIRRDMPLEAWVLLVPGIREARRRGLLHGWQAGKRGNTWNPNRPGCRASVLTSAARKCSGSCPEDSSQRT